MEKGKHDAITESENEDHNEEQAILSPSEAPLKPKRKYTQTDKSKKAFEKMQEARKKQIEEIRKKKQIEELGGKYDGKIYKKGKKNIKVTFNDDSESEDSESEYIVKRVSSKRKNKDHIIKNKGLNNIATREKINIIKNEDLNNMAEEEFTDVTNESFEESEEEIEMKKPLKKSKVKPVKQSIKVKKRYEYQDEDDDNIEMSHYYSNRRETNNGLTLSFV